MKSIAATRLLLWIILVSVGIIASATVFPSKASAAELLAQTAPLLPAGPQNACAPLTASGFTPYIYNNALHSFELTLNDSSYVAISATVGNTQVPFYQMSRHFSAPGSIRIHADLNTTPLRGALPITVTLLSAKGPGQPVCVSVVGTVLGEGSFASLPMPKPTPPSPAPVPTPTPSSAKPAPTPTPSPTSAPSTTTKTKETKTTSTAAMGSVLKDICSPTNAPKLWIVLLVIYAVLVAGAVFGQQHLPAFMRSQESTAAAIVIPFLFLFALWYFAESCRISAWAPAIATIIALAGLAVAFWDRTPQGPQVINLPSAKK